MNIFITGASGFLGTHLTKLLSHKHTLTLVSRQKKKLAQYASHTNISILTWDELDENPSILQSMDVIVHLCGQSILGIWTENYKNKLYQSRANPLKQIDTYLNTLSHKPRIICASGVGIYGYQYPTDHTPLTEEHPEQHSFFLSKLAKSCESALSTERQKHTCYLRFGVVLDKSGGSLPLMMLPHYLSLGMIVGSGDQAFSCVSLTDAVGAIIFAIDHQLTGPFNIVTPEPYTNATFNHALAKAMHRRCFLRLPKFLSVFFGEMFDNTVVKGQRVSSQKIQNQGFQFKQPTISKIINH